MKRLARASGGASSARGACAVAVAVAEHRVAAPVVLYAAVITYLLGRGSGSVRLNHGVTWPARDDLLVLTSAR